MLNLLRDKLAEVLRAVAPLVGVVSLMLLVLVESPAGLIGQFLAGSALVVLGMVLLFAGVDLGILIGGAILTETVFNIPGIGRLAFDSIQKSDLPIVQGTVLIAALAIILMNLVVDILYAFLDPRVRY